MYENQGSLALQKRQKAGRRPRLTRPAVQRPPVPLKRIRIADLPVTGSQIEAQALAIRRALVWQRVRTLLLTALLVMFVSGLFGLIVYRQAMILKQNFDNLGMERNVAKISQKCGQINEELAQKTDLDQIRHLAVERLGLQDPAQRQVLMVSIPDSDRVIFASDTAAATGDEAGLAAVFENIEGFFKTIAITSPEG